MGKNVYSSKVKWAVVKDKASGELTTKEIMEKRGIKNMVSWHLIKVFYMCLISLCQSKLQAFLYDGRIEIDNNPAENAIRPKVVAFYVVVKS